ncbi:unnamed protein product [Symbiodinium sp. CCMP2456]|nr:unnamed protein product [Symbiodinium sp. CCMP2456]
MEYKADRSDRSGLYFGASVPPPDKLELSSLLQVKDKWGVAGTLADMRMCAATWTIAQCYQEEFSRTPDFWTG